MLIGLIMLVCEQSFSQVDTTKVAFVAYWSIGDVYDYKVTKIKEEWKEKILKKKDSSQYIASFKVIDSSDKHYKISWKYKNNFSDTYRLPKELVGKFSKYKFTEVIYTTTEMGEFVGIENWEEIRDITKGVFVDVIETFKKEDPDKYNKMVEFMKPFVDIYSSKEGIEGVVLKELQYIHFPFGLEYDIREVLEYEDEFPNMLGGDPIKANAKLFFEDVDFENEYCTIRQESKINADDMKSVVLGLFKRMGLKGEKMREAMSKAKFDINDTNMYQYFYFPGVATNINTQREVIINIEGKDARRLEKTRIELIIE